MKIFNTMTRKKEELTPLVPGEYRIYVCGPTVYNYVHIGNARPVVVFDTLRRYLEYQGNRVLFVSNITDIDDKIIAKANEAGVSMQEYAGRYEAEFLKDCDGLNALPPTVRPRATEHIDEILSIVADIIEKGYGYVAKNGDVYFRAKKFKEYGKLSHLVLEDLESGNRALRSQMDGDLKEDPADFAVWKAAKPGEPYWDSPYGKGRPGWHIECSAMARRHLGKTIDIHAGGEDLIFPHHENEIAQSECANGCTFARYWMHNGFLNIDNHKMSKSANNFFTVRELSEVYGYEPIRYFLLTGQYRGPLNYTAELIGACKASLERLYTCRDNLDFAIENAHGDDEALVEKAAAAREKFCAAMDDDLNTPDALAALFDFVREINTLAPQSSRAALEAAADAFDALTGVLGILYNRKKDEIPADILALVDERAAAKKAKDRARADAIRAELTEKGYTLKATVTKEQARTLKEGLQAEITNLWDSGITMTLTSITSDKKDPANSRVLTFAVTGEDVSVGQSLSFSVGDKNSSYDLVIPSAAIHTDADGSFVYTVQVKSSPLGNRYTVRKKTVSIVASDDNNSAVSGELSSDDFVITTATVPLKVGTQVRIAE